MSTLFLAGYRTITPQQYANWLAGNTVGLPAKPILITFDNNIANTQAAVSILATYGFTATMHVVTGFADSPQGWNMDWTALAALKAAGWTIQLNAGPRGYSAITPAQACSSYYPCRASGETAATYQARVESDIAAGLTALQTRGLITGPSITFATPWDDWGQTSTDTTVTSWLPGYLASQFQVVFQQDWGYVAGSKRRYCFQVLASTTLAAFNAALTHTRFARSG